MVTKCRNCGGDNAIHHYLTMQCPFGGKEEPNLDREQQWMTSTFSGPTEIEIELLEALKSIENDDNHIPESIWNMRNQAIKNAEGK